MFTMVRRVGFYTFAPLCFFSTILFVWGVTGSRSEAAAVDEMFRPVPLDQIELGGEIGRRMDITVKNNLKKLDIEGDFLKPFRERNGKSGKYVGLGKVIESLVHFAIYTGDPEILALKNYIVSEIIKT